MRRTRNNTATEAPVTWPLPVAVPFLMSDVRKASSLNKFTVVSTFSGGGGSSTGYRLAGGRVLAVNEFVKAARETYTANYPDVAILPADIRDITGADLCEAAGVEPGELDILDGSPPCASFSMAGLREKAWGKTKKYSDTEQRCDDLFFEFVRVLKDVQPKVFIAENVKGLTAGAAKGVLGTKRRGFRDMMDSAPTVYSALQDAGYQVAHKVLNAADYGVPQTRQRVILIGIRNDLCVTPTYPKPTVKKYVTLRDVLKYAAYHGTHPAGTFEPKFVDSNKRAAPTISTAVCSGNGLVVDDLSVVHDTSGNRSQGDVTDKPSPCITVGVDSLNSRHYQIRESTTQESVWQEDGTAIDPETGARIDIKSCAIEAEHVKLLNGELPRFFNLTLATEDKASPTITAAGGGRSVAGVVLSTPRKFTLLELRRICSFPDDYVLTGTYSHRWERLGRAVPPLMMKAVAEHVYETVLKPTR